MAVSALTATTGSSSFRSEQAKAFRSSGAGASSRSSRARSFSSPNARQSLSQYIIRAPVGLEKLTWNRDEDTLSWKAPEKGHFKGEVRHFDCLDFIARVSLHIPRRAKLGAANRTAIRENNVVRRYGVYSSRGGSTWKTRPALKAKAPSLWYGWARQPGGVSLLLGDGIPYDNPVEVGAAARKKEWVRLLAKIYDVNPARIAPRFATRRAKPFANARSAEGGWRLYDLQSFAERNGL